uniref:NADH-ubiquinone oxidoreductase chain 5 n=1 Tax=Brettanomyces custersianus TaxID=13368 RepID=C7FEW0_BRECS|nr:Nad5p [Brettanomyces custersianus]ACU32817.1 Nad5p [Brettanomyces custersianus]
MVNVIVFSTVIGSLISGFLGRYIGVKWSRRIVCLSVIMSLVATYILYFEVMIQDNEYRNIIMSWISVDYLNIDWGFLIDKVSVSILIPVVTISCLVHIYAVVYMGHDPHQQRFFSYLSFFTFGMIVLVTGDNLLILFLGWELIGVASYLLISFWFTRITAAKSGLNSLLMNRFGDTFFVIGLGLIVYLVGSLNFDTLFSLNAYLSTDMLTIILICLLLGCASKSVQFGLHTWLLNSMEGPTPVSSLLHAACLVIAGIYLLVRCSYIIEYSPVALIIILVLGGITTLVSGLMAVTANDVKRIVALSTMSQVGIMMLGVGISAYNLAIFHVICHSFFKALLFMSAGAIIHAVANGYQDIRTYGGFLKFLPLTYVCVFIASLSLMALPGLTGYYSKDIIIETLYGSYTFTGYIIYWFALSSAVLTSIYSIRLMYYVFFNRPNDPKYIYMHLTENPTLMYIPMSILALLSIFVGYLAKDLYLGLGTPIYNYVFIHPNNLAAIDTEFSLNSYIKLLPLICSVILCTILVIMYELFYNKLFVYNHHLFKTIYSFFNQKLYYDQILNNYGFRSWLYISYLLNTYIDKGVLIFLGPYGLSSLTLSISNLVNKLVFFNLGLIIELIFFSIFLALFLNSYTFLYFVIAFIIFIWL